MSNLLNLPASHSAFKLTHGLNDDMHEFVTGDRWTVTATDAGGATMLNTVGGIVQLDASDGTVADNDEVYLHQTSESFKFADDKPLRVGAYIQYAEANTDDANIMFGLADACAANHLLNDGAGPAASFSGAAFYKVDGGTRWQLIVSDSTTQTKVDLTAANSADGVAKTAGGASYTWLEIEIKPTGQSSKADVSFYIDDVLVYKFADYDYSNATDIEVGFGVKNGSANEEKLNIDAVYAYQKR